MNAGCRPAGSLNGLVTDVLRAERRPMTGLEIFQHLNETGTCRFLSQTYRAVSELRASGTVRRIELANSYTLGTENIVMN